MQTNHKIYQRIFSVFDKILWAILCILFVLAVIVLYFLNDLGGCWHDFALSYISGMIVYILTVAIPSYINRLKLTRTVVNDMALLRKAYRDLLLTISDKSQEDPYTLEQIQSGLVRFSSHGKPGYICLSSRTVEIIKPKCERIQSLTSMLLTKPQAFSADELLVVHEITQVWFLKNVMSLDDDHGYVQKKDRMMKKAEYLVLRYNELEKLYKRFKKRTNVTIGWHP